MEMAANLDHEEESEKYSRQGRGQVALGGLGGSSGLMAATDPGESDQDLKNWVSSHVAGNCGTPSYRIRTRISAIRLL